MCWQGGDSTAHVSCKVRLRARRTMLTGDVSQVHMMSREAESDLGAPHGLPGL